MIAVAAAIAISVGVGVGLERRLGPRADRAARALLTTMLFTVLPFVTFFNIVRLHVTAAVGGGIAFAYAALALTALVAWAVARHGLGLRRPGAGAMVNAAILANTGYLGLPLTVALLGGDRLGEAVAYDSLVGGPVLLVAGFAVGAGLGARAGERRRDRVRAFLSRNPPLIAAVAALLAPDAAAPDALVEASRTLVLAVLPAGFVAVGAILSSEAGALAWPPPITPAVGIAVVARLLLAPALLVALSAPFIDLPPPYLLLAAMPCGINSVTVAHVYGLDLRISAAAVAWSTAIVVAAGLAAVAIL
ncbi:MAG: transporter [Solirubrobacteraceae bacterium]